MCRLEEDGGGYNQIEKNTGGQFFSRRQDRCEADKMFTSYQDLVVLRSQYKIIRFQSKHRLKAH